jgi:hypothetical protein
VIEGRRVAGYVYTKLTADTGGTGVNTLLGGRIYGRRAPQGVTLPACVIQLVSATATNTLSGVRTHQTALVDVHLIAEGSNITPLVAIADRIDTVLQGAHGISDGATVVKLRRDDEREYDEDDGGVSYCHQITTWRTEVYAP